MDQSTFVKQIRESNTSGDSISLYIHIPFCAKLCNFCGCHTSPMKKEQFIRRYINALKIEISNTADLLDCSRPVTQIHWGGGTPNSINFDYIAEVMKHISTLFTLAEYAEVAMECNPAHLSLDGITYLSEMGFNRLSLGIQDFDLEVLKSINRDPSKEPVKDLVDHMKSLQFKGINIDLVYGLPGQTVESFTRAVKETIAAAPHRIVTFSYAHVPWVKAAQKILEKKGLPDSDSKLAMFESAYELLTKSGYRSIGLDHYVLEDDELYQAQQRNELHRNFQGYCSVKTTGQVYGFGCSSISQLHGAYIQNRKSDLHYIEDIETAGFAFVRGYEVSPDQQIVRTVINAIMCDGHLDFAEMAHRFGITVEELTELLQFTPSKLTSFIEDDLLTFDGTILHVTERGFFVVRNIAMAFDPMLNENEQRYSQTI